MSDSGGAGGSGGGGRDEGDEAGAGGFGGRMRCVPGAENDANMDGRAFGCSAGPSCLGAAGVLCARTRLTAS